MARADALLARREAHRRRGEAERRRAVEARAASENAVFNAVYDAVLPVLGPRGSLGLTQASDFLVPGLGAAITAEDSLDILRDADSPLDYALGTALGGLAAAEMVPLVGKALGRGGRAALKGGLKGASDDVLAFIGDEAGSVGKRSVTSGDIALAGRYSPTRLAAENLRQGRGTYDEMRKALLAGGGKEDELVWSGFDRTFGGRTDKIGLDEVQRYLQDNTDYLDEVQYTAPGKYSAASADIDSWDAAEKYVEDRLEDEMMYYRDQYFPETIYDQADELRNLGSDIQVRIAEATGYGDDVQRMLDENPDGLVVNRSWPPRWDSTDDFAFYKDADEAVAGEYPDDVVREYADESLRESWANMGAEERFEALGLDPSAGEGGTQYGDYFTPGAEDYTETLHIFDRDIPSPGDPHWSESYPPVVHTRRGSFPTSVGGKAHHVGEVQSDWGQGIRGGDIASPQSTMELEDFRRHALERDARDFFYDWPLTSHTERMGTLGPQSHEGVEFIANMRPPEGEDVLPLLWPPEAVAAREFGERHGIDDYLRKTEMLDAIDRGDLQPNAPYVGKTEKWVDYGLRSELRDAALYGDADTFTIGTGEMAKAMTGGDVGGQSEFYDKIVPRRLEKILRGIDKSRRLEPQTILTDAGPKQVLGFTLDDALRQAIRTKGLPLAATLPFLVSPQEQMNGGT